MSRSEYHKGKINELYIENSLEDTCREIVEEANMTDRLSDGYSATELVRDEMGKNFVIVGNKIYCVLEDNEVDPDFDIFNASRNDDGTVSFEVKYYNGGCSFDEAVGKAIEKMIDE